MKCIFSDSSELNIDSSTLSRGLLLSLLATVHAPPSWLMWPLPLCVDSLCAGSSSKNPGCLAFQSGSYVEGLWVLLNTLINDRHCGCRQVVPQREPLPSGKGSPQPSALNGREPLLTWKMYILHEICFVSSSVMAYSNIIIVKTTQKTVDLSPLVVNRWDLWGELQHTCLLFFKMYTPNFIHTTCCTYFNASSTSGILFCFHRSVLNYCIVSHKMIYIWIAYGVPEL